MANEQPLTESSLVAALKEAGVATKEDIQGIDTRLGKVEARLGDVETRLGNVETRVGNVENRLGDVETRIGGVETTIKAMDAKLSNVETNMVTKVEFDKRVNGLEAKMDTKERSLKKRMGEHRTEIMTAVSKLATSTPTLKEFKELRARVDRHHRLS